MKIKSVSEFNFQSRRALVRADFNVPQKDGKITDDTRIRAVVPTIKHILSYPKSRVVIMSHMGRPKGNRQSKLSLSIIASRLQELCGCKVTMANDCIGAEVKILSEQLPEGQILLLENLRFYPEEEAGDENFAKELACLGDVYVNDAFGTAHRAHASTAVVARYLPALAGFLMEKEITVLSKLLVNAESPFVAVIGGAKISSKVDVILNLLPKIDRLLIGGGMAYTFLAGNKVSIGESLYEKEFEITAKNLLKKSKELGVITSLPSDHLIADRVDLHANYKITDGVDIPDKFMGVDIGVQTVEVFQKEIELANTILWNGPMGIFEIPQFSEGTKAVARAISKNRGISVVGGGDSVAAINNLGFHSDITHISTGGGASIELLEGKVLPGVESLGGTN